MTRLQIAKPCVAIIAAISALAAQAQGVRRPDCHIMIIRDVTDDLGNAWKAGQTLPVDIARDSTAGGAFCAHGGSCVPRRIGGVRASRLTDCRAGALIAGTDHRLIASRR